MARTVVNMPAQAKKGEVIEIRTLAPRAGINLEGKDS